VTARNGLGAAHRALDDVLSYAPVEPFARHLVRSCVSAAAWSLENFCDLIQEETPASIPLEQDARAFPAAIKDQENADSALRTTSWVFMVRLVAANWDDQFSTHVGIWQRCIPLRESTMSFVERLRALAVDLLRAEQGPQTSAGDQDRHFHGLAIAWILSSGLGSGEVADHGGPVVTRYWTEVFLGGQDYLVDLVAKGVPDDW